MVTNQAKPKAPMRMQGICILLGFLGIGAVLLFQAGPMRMIEALSSRGWHETLGTLAEVHVEEVDMGAGAKKRWYEVRLKYVFDVAGHAVHGERIGFWPDHRQLLEIRKYAAAYQPGLAVRVFYNPSNPIRSALDRTIVQRFWILASPGVLLLALGLGFVTGYVGGARRG